jgi:hypothetical protein
MVCCRRLARLSKRAVNCLQYVVLRLAPKGQLGDDDVWNEPHWALMNHDIFKNGDRHGIGQ